MSRPSPATAALMERGSETRQLILRSALREFAQNGFDGTSNRQIASAAGVHHGLIRHYFGAKLKLWQAAVDLAFGDMKGALDTLTADPSSLAGRDQVRALLRAYVRFVAEHPEFVSLMYEEGKRRGPRMRWIVDRHVEPIFAAIAALLGHGPTRRLFPAELTPIYFFYALAGASGAIFHQAEECKRLSGIDPFDPEAVEQQAKVIEWLFMGAVDDPTRSMSTEESR